jgi:hypothetical protein
MFLRYRIKVPLSCLVHCLGSYDSMMSRSVGSIQLVNPPSPIIISSSRTPSCHVGSAHLEPRKSTSWGQLVAILRFFFQRSSSSRLYVRVDLLHERLGCYCSLLQCYIRCGRVGGPACGNWYLSILHSYLHLPPFYVTSSVCTVNSAPSCNLQSYHDINGQCKASA